MPKKIILETYSDDTFVARDADEPTEKKKSIFDKAKGWIKNYQDKKKEDEQFKDGIKQEAKVEARVEVVPILKEQYKKEEIDRLTGKNKGDFMAKLKGGLTSSNGDFIASDERMNKMLGKKTNTETKEVASGKGGPDNDTISRLMGRNSEKIKDEKYSKGVNNEDILSMMSVTGGKKSNTDAVTNDKIKGKMNITGGKTKNTNAISDDKIKSMSSLSSKESSSSVEDKLKRMLGKK